MHWLHVNSRSEWLPPKKMFISDALWEGAWVSGEEE